MATTDITTNNIAVAATPGATSKRGSTPHSRLRRLRLHTIHHLDGRSIAARRAKAVVRDLVQALGGTATPMQLQAIERAAMHVVIAEDYAARKLAGEAVCALEMIRAENTARRSVAAILAMKPEPPEPTERPGLAIARRRWAAQDAARAAQAKQEKTNE